MLNRVILMGRLTHDPEFRQTASGIPSCRFSVAVNRKKSKDGQQEADFIDCESWRSTAEFISRYFSKGSMIIVEGELRNNNYTDKNGVKHYEMKVLCENVSFGESKRAQEGAAPQQQYQNQGYPEQPQGYPPQYGAAPPPQQYQQQYQAPPQYGSLPAPNGNPYHPNR